MTESIIDILNYKNSSFWIFGEEVTASLQSLHFSPVTEFVSYFDSYLLCREKISRMFELVDNPPIKVGNPAPRSHGYLWHYPKEPTTLRFSAITLCASGRPSSKRIA